MAHLAPQVYDLDFGCKRMLCDWDRSQFRFGVS